MTRIPNIPRIAFATLLCLGACVAGDEQLQDPDPAGTVDDHEPSDDGLTTSEASSDLQEDALAAFSSNAFQLPFPCRQVWSGQTRINHSPQNAIDFNRANDFGDNVVASAGGRVTRVDNEGDVSYGRWIEISHGGGFTSRYAHLSVQAVRVGQTVRIGQHIGNVGATGDATGPHLHYEQRLNGSAVRVKFNGVPAFYFGTRNYVSHNSCP